MISSSLRRSCFPNSLSAKDCRRTRYSARITIYSPGLGSMQTMIAGTHECCSKLVVCGVRERCTRNSKTLYREWELRSNLITRIMRSSIASSTTPNTASRLQQQTNYRHRVRTRTHAVVRGATLKALLGMVETISNHSLERDVTLPLLSRRLVRSMAKKLLYRKLDRPISNFHDEQRIYKTRRRMTQKITLEPG